MSNQSITRSNSSSLYNNSSVDFSLTHVKSCEDPYLEPSVKNHVEKSMDIQKFPCQFCHKSFSTKSNLVAHQTKTKKCLLIQGKVADMTNQLSAVNISHDKESSPLLTAFDDVKNKIENMAKLLHENQKNITNILMILNLTKLHTDNNIKQLIDQNYSVNKTESACGQQCHNINEIDHTKNQKGIN